MAPRPPHRPRLICSPSQKVREARIKIESKYPGGDREGSELTALREWTRLLGPASKGPANCPEVQMLSKPRARYLEADASRVIKHSFSI